VRLSTTTTYTVFLSSILFMVIGSQLLIQYGLNQQNDDAAHINLAGRQLMLSQQISKLALYIERDNLLFGQSHRINAHDLDTLKKLAEIWKSEYYRLLMGAQSGRYTKRIDELLRENALRLDTIEVACKSMIANPYPLTISKSVKTIAAMEKPFLSSMGKIVDAYQQEAEQKLSALKRIEIFLAVITVAILALELIFIFYPLIKGQQEANKKLELAAQDLRMAKEKSDAATIAKSEFLSSMSHEIRTPLNGVIGFTDLLMNTSLDNSQRQYVATVNQSAISLLTIINDILDFSKIEVGKLELAIEKTDLLELCHQVTDVVKFQSQEKGLKMLVTISDQVPRFAWADPVRLRQVLINLLGNAVKFTLKGEVELKVEQAISAKDGKTMLHFSVRDTGIGIKAANQEKIFQAFSQEDATTTKKFGGTGLGLFISNKLLALMGSHLQLKSEPEKGSIFYFEVSLKTEHAENPLNGKQVTSSKPTKRYVSFESIKILIAEDNLVNMRLIKILIGEILPNATLIEATNGKIAVEKFAEEKPTIVFMDVQMPEMNGYDATVAIRRMEQESILLPFSNDETRTPIIALTAGVISGEKEKCLATGMDDFVSKPIANSAIDDILCKWLKVAASA
jgi:signal transduction histidine kinase/CheY-like chemotaxis protein